MFKLLFSIFCLACPIHSYVKVLNLRHFKTNLFGKNEFSLKVAGDDVKQRLDVFLASQISEHSRSFLGNLCDQSAVNVNNTPQTKNYKVKKGDVVTLTIEDIAPSSVEPEDIPLDILYEDDDIIAVNKPPGMVVHPAPGSPNNTFVNALLYHIGKSAADLLNANSSETRTLSTTTTTMTTTSDLLIDEEGWETIDLPETPEAAVSSSSFLRPGIVHRLDKGTSGVLIAGKHPEAVSKLSRLFFLREIRKIYLAICVGHPGEATMVDPIGRCSKNRQLMTVYDGPPGKPATSHFRTLAFDGKLSAALVRIETGRTHQIRVHLKERRTPIAGDEDYGNKDWNKKLIRSLGIRRPLLHAYETEFEHPFTGKTILLRAPVPDDMATVMKTLVAENAPIFDPITRYLIGTTEVRGKQAGERGGNKGFVPSDRIAFEDDQDYWLTELPESEEELLLSPHFKDIDDSVTRSEAASYSTTMRFRRILTFG